MDKILKTADDILKVCRVGDHWLCVERAAVVKILKELVEEKSTPCSLCKTWVGGARYTFCPDCGRKLDK